MPAEDDGLAIGVQGDVEDELLGVEEVLDCLFVELDAEGALGGR